MGYVILGIVCTLFLLLIILRLTAPKAPAKGSAQCPTCKLKYDPSLVECPVCGPEASTVLLTDPGPQQLEVIKIIREVGGLGLKEAKDMVDAPPQTVVRGVTPEVAAKIVERLAKYGAKAEVR